MGLGTLLHYRTSPNALSISIPTSTPPRNCRNLQYHASALKLGNIFATVPPHMLRYCGIANIMDDICASAPSHGNNKYFALPNSCLWSFAHKMAPRLLQITLRRLRNRALEVTDGQNSLTTPPQPHPPSRYTASATAPSPCCHDALSCIRIKGTRICITPPPPQTCPYSRYHAAARVSSKCMFCKETPATCTLKPK